MQASVPGFQMAATEPPLGEAGVQIHTTIDLVPRAVVGATITSTCKNVDRVVEWLDYMYSPEGQMLLNMGIEGTHYTMVDGEPIFTDYVLNNPDGLSPKEAVGTFTIAQGTMPSVLCLSEVNQLDDASVVEAKETCIIPFLETSNQYVIPGTLSFSSEQDAERRAAMADIETYVDEKATQPGAGLHPGPQLSVGERGGGGGGHAGAGAGGRPGHRPVQRRHPRQHRHTDQHQTSPGARGSGHHPGGLLPRIRRRGLRPGRLGRAVPLRQRHRRQCGHIHRGGPAGDLHLCHSQQLLFLHQRVRVYQLLASNPQLHTTAV